MAVESSTIKNFGRNVSFQPQMLLTPHSEEEVLQILKRYAGRRIRTIGRLHSWSEVICGDDVLLDLRHLNGVQTEPRGEGLWATIGGGCQMKRVLSELERQAGATTPSIGLITEQAIAGAISTGTHGSGKHSLSHYIAEVRVATYEAATGEPIILTISEGTALRAARCSLGCLGVIISVGLWVRPQYRVEEHFRRHATLTDVLAAEAQYPLQQFYLIPWTWDFYGQHRREVTTRRSWLARLYRCYFFLTFDLGMHLVILLLVQWLRTKSGVRFFFRWLMPWTVVRGWKVVDSSDDMLVMEHELFRHIEIEIFVKRSRLGEAIPFVQELLRHCDGESDALSSSTQAKLQSLGLYQGLVPLLGTYTHHYPICVRRVLPDDTLISMASGETEDWYAISLVSCAKPTARTSYFQFSEQLARTTAALFQARTHWGKYCPTDAKTAASLYPHLADFREVCRQLDPHGRFRNTWVERLLFAED